MRNKPFRRSDRAADQILRELSIIIAREVDDPRVAGITLSGIELSKDLRHAKVFVTLAETVAPEPCLDALNRAAGFVRRQLGARVRMKRLPALRFYHDTTLDRATRLDRLLAEASARSAANRDVDLAVNDETDEAFDKPSQANLEPKCVAGPPTD